MKTEKIEIEVPKFKGFKYVRMGKVDLNDFDKYFIQIDKCFYPYSAKECYLLNSPALASNGLPLDIGVCVIYEKEQIIDKELQEAIEEFPKHSLAKLVGRTVFVEILEEAIRETSETSTKEVLIKTSLDYHRPRELIAVSKYSFTIKRPNGI